MDAHYINVTLFWKKEDYTTKSFLGIKWVKEPQLIIVYITQRNLIQLFKLFRPTFCISTISFLNFIIVLIHKPFVTNNRTSTPFPKSNPVGCCKFHPPDIEVTIVSIQIKWNKLVATSSLHEPKELRIIPCNFLLENNVMKGFMYIRLYSYNSNH